MHVRGHIRANTRRVNARRLQWNRQYLSFQFQTCTKLLLRVSKWKEQLQINAIGFSRCMSAPQDHVAAIFGGGQGGNNEGHERGSEMDDTALGIIGSM